MRGIFGSMFDRNRDGRLDHFERAMEFEFLEELEREEDSDYCEDYDDEDDEDYDFDETELELAGIDPEELEYMDEDERREVLEEAGLSMDDFDF